MIQNPEAFWLLLVFIPLALIFFNSFKKGSHDLKRIGGGWRENSYYDVFVVKWFLSSLFFSFFVLFTILSVVGFSWTSSFVDEEKRDTEVMFVVDVSRSMYCRDISPSRLGRSAGVIRGIIEGTPGIRAGITVFKGEGLLSVPPTEDTEALTEYLSMLSTEVMTAPGSNIENGLKKAADGFTSGEGRKRMIILFSDGESLSGNADRAVDYVSGKEVNIYTIGAGTPEGGIIPLDNNDYVRDRNGDKVITHLKAAPLKSLVSESEGEYFSLQEPLLVSKLLRIVSESGAGGFSEQPKESYSWFLLAAVVSLFLYFSVRIVKWKNTF